MATGGVSNTRQTSDGGDVSTRTENQEEKKKERKVKTTRRPTAPLSPASLGSLPAVELHRQQMVKVTTVWWRR